jgi:protein-disulfide isomerase
MKKLSLFAAALLVSACGGEGGNTTAATSNAPLEQVAAPNGGDWTKTVTQTAEGGMLMGNPDAKVKVVEFGSMTCHICQDFAAEGEPKLVENYVKSGQVSYEFRNFVRDPLDISMSLITRCTGATPQFFQLTSALYADQPRILEQVQKVPPQQLQALQSASPAQQFTQFAQFAGLQSWAAQRGLPSAKTSQCLASQAEAERLVQMTSDASSQYEVTGTPTFVLNGELADPPQAGQTHWQALERQIRSALG